MFATSGVADGGRPHLRPYPHRNKLHRAGHYAVNLGLTLFMQDGDYSGRTFQAALMTRQPQPEGGAYKELAAPGYARQSVHMRWAASDYDLNSAEIAFGPVSSAWDEASHFGLFDDIGTMVAYGRIIALDQGDAAGFATFRPSSIRLKHRRSGANRPV